MINKEVYFDVYNNSNCRRTQIWKEIEFGTQWGTTKPKKNWIREMMEDNGTEKEAESRDDGGQRSRKKKLNSRDDEDNEAEKETEFKRWWGQQSRKRNWIQEMMRTTKPQMKLNSRDDEDNEAEKETEFERWWWTTNPIKKSNSNWVKRWTMTIKRLKKAGSMGNICLKVLSYLP